MRRGLLFLYPGCIYHEVADAVFRLSDSFGLDVCAPTAGPCRTGEGLEIVAARSYDEVDPARSSVALIPGGDVEVPICHAAAHALLRRLASRDDLLLASICNGTVVLGSAGVLGGRRVTHTVHPSYAAASFLDVLGPHVAGATFVDEDVVEDDMLITAKPWAYTAFAERVLQRLGAG